MQQIHRKHQWQHSLGDRLRQEPHRKVDQLHPVPVPVTVRVQQLERNSGMDYYN